MKSNDKVHVDETIRVWYQAHTDVLAIWYVCPDGRVSIETRDPWDGNGLEVKIKGETYRNYHWHCLGEF